MLSFKALVIVKPFDEFFCEANDVPLLATFSAIICQGALNDHEAD